jgi:hypothetical protein
MARPSLGLLISCRLNGSFVLFIGILWFTYVPYGLQ